MKNILNPTLFNKARLLIVLMLSSFCLQSFIYAQSNCDFENLSMINDPNGTNPPSFDINLICVDITYPVCPEDAASVYIEWERIGNATSLARFEIIDISGTNTIPPSQMIFFNESNGSHQFSIPYSGLYDLKFVTFGGFDDLLYPNNPFDFSGSGNQPIVIGDPQNVQQPYCDTDEGFFQIITISGGSTESTSPDDFTFYVNEIDPDNIFNPFFGTDFGFLDSDGDGDVSGDEFMVTIIAQDNNSPCSGELNYTFEDPGYIESEIKIHHQSCTEEQDAYLEVDVIGNIGDADVTTFWQEYNPIENEYTAISFQNTSNGSPNDLLLDVNDGGLESYIYWEPNSIDGISTDYDLFSIDNYFSGIGGLDGRKFIVEVNYQAPGVLCPIVNITESSPLEMYRLLEPELNTSTVELTQPTCPETNGPPSPEGDPFDTSDDDAGGIIKFPINGLSGGDNLNDVFGINLSEDDWDFVLYLEEDNGNEIPIQTFQSSDIDNNNFITWENLEEGTYYIDIEYPSIDITTVISFPGAVVSYEINQSFDECVPIRYGPFILEEPAEIDFLAVGNSSANLCNGQSNGDINFTNIDGGSPYITEPENINSIEGNNGFYEITIYDSNQLDVITNPNLPAGTYYVTLKDSNQCESTPQEILITEPDPFTLDSSSGFSWTVSEEVDCYNQPEATVTITFNPLEELLLTPPYTYQLIDISSDGGTYNQTITLNDGIQAVFNELYDLNDGPQGTQYQLIISDSNFILDPTLNSSCSASTIIEIIGPDTELEISVVTTDVLCNGGNTGTAVYTVTGGTAPYDIQDDLTLTAGGYTTTVTDDNGCQASVSFTIDEPDAELEISVVTTDVLCNGGNTGTAVYTVTGGTAPYDIQDDLTLTAGSYTTTVTDDNGCQASVSFTIDEPDAALQISAITTDVTCNNGTDGEVELIVTGGTNATNTIIPDLSAGEYTETYTDDNGCDVSITFTIGEPDPFIIDSDITNISCSEYNDGSIDLSVSGNNGGYSFLWDTGANTSSIDNLSPGTYSVTITDQLSCETTETYNITEPTPLTFEVISSDTELECSNSVGNFTILITGGTEPYNYSWTDGNNNFISEGDVTPGPLGGFINSIEGLTGGIYNLTITDDNGCPLLFTDEINIGPTSINFELTDNSFLEVECFGDETGIIEISAFGGTPPYEFNWYNSDNDFIGNGVSTIEDDVTINTIQDLGEDIYYLELTDDNGCENNEFSIEITTEPEAPVDINLLLTSDYNGYGVECNGDSNGFINIEMDPNGGIIDDGDVWDYVWYPTFIATGNELDISLYGNNPTYLENLPPSVYWLIAEDSNGCRDTLNYEITEPEPVTIDEIITTQLITECNGTCSGSIEVIVSGGAEPYSYIWTEYLNSGTNTLESNNSSVTDLCSGNYSVSVFDANGCPAFDGDIEIIEPEPLTIENIQVSEYYNCIYNISCAEENDGSIDINVAGGTEPYTYNWDFINDQFDINGELINEGSSVSELSAGTYSVDITDANGCELTQEIILTAPTPLVIEDMSIETIATYCLENGEISLDVSGGCGDPYTFSLFPSLEDGTITGDCIEGESVIQNGNNLLYNGIGTGWYTIILSDGEPNIEINSNDDICNTSEVYPCNTQLTFFMEETDQASFDIFAEADLGGTITPNWIQVNEGTPNEDETIIAEETTIGFGSCGSTISILNPDGVIGDFGGSGLGYELYWFINNGTDANTLDDEDTALSLYNNDLSIEVDVQLQGQSFILLYVDLCPNGPDSIVTLIEVPFMDLEIDAQSSLFEYSSGETPFGAGEFGDEGIDIDGDGVCDENCNYESSISCAGENNAYATFSITGGSSDDFNNASCLDDGAFWTVTWYLDNGDTEFNEFDNEIINGDFIEEDNFPVFSGGDGIPDTYTLQTLEPGFYFAQIQDCLSNGCGLIVDFDLRPEADPLVMQTVITQEDCGLNEGASACFFASGGTPTITGDLVEYEFNLTWIEPNTNTPTPINVTDGCASPEDLEPGLYQVYLSDNNNCETEVFPFEINIGNYVDEALIEIELFSYPGGYNVSCSNATDGSIESMTIYSLEDIDGDGDINTVPLSDIDNDGVINTLDTDMDGDGIINTLDTDMDGDGIFVNGICIENCNDDCTGLCYDSTPYGLDTDDVIAIWDGSTDNWSFINPIYEVEVEWNPWDINSLAAGDYSATIYSLSPNGIDQCATEFDFSISTPGPLYVFVPDYEICEGCAVNVTAQISGGQGPYYDIWTNTQTGQILPNIIDPDFNPGDVTDIGIDYDVDGINGYPRNILLLPGSYSLEIIDASNCDASVIKEFEIYEAAPTLPWAELEITGCEPSTGSCGGIATITIDYNDLNSELCQIQWFNCDGQSLDGSMESENVINNLCNGNYYAQILYPEDNDINGSGTTNSQDPDMDGDGIPNDGFDGIPNNADDDPDIDGDGILNEYDNFAEGNYRVTTMCFEYNEDGFEIFEECIQHDLCADDSFIENSISIYTEGGSGEFTFLWSNEDGTAISTTQNLENQPAGIYTVNVTDSYGCQMWEEFEIFETEELVVVDIALSDFNGYNVACAENADENICNGEITLEINGGIPFNTTSEFNSEDCNFNLPGINMNSYYEYSINNLENEISTENQILNTIEISGETIIASINGVCAGTNIITINDQVGCLITLEIIMTGPDIFEFDIIASDVSCANSEDGSIQIEYSGGLPPYSYQWWLDDILYSTSANITNLSGGSYTIEVIDFNNCTYSDFIDIYEPLPFEIEAFPNGPECDQLIGYVEFNVSGSHEGNYQYSVNNQDLYDYNASDIIDLTSGEYIFTFIDSQGCESEDIIVNIDPASENCLEIPSLFTPNGDGQNDIWEIIGIEDYPNAKIDIYNRWGQIIFTSSGNYFGNEWDGTHNGTPLPYAVYYYIIDPVNENGKTYHGGVTIKR